MIKKRFEQIDFLRAVAIVGVIAIHTLSYSLNNRVTYFFWNYLNFVVVSFVFCSGYVLTYLYKEKFRTDFKVVAWFIKRASKLLIPFYIYLAIHYSLWLIFPQYFNGAGLQKSTLFIFKSLFLLGGVDLNWLPLLFLQLTLLFPFFMKGLKQTMLLKIYIPFALLITIFFTLYRFPYAYYRPAMWISWSTILLLAIYIFSKDNADTSSRTTVSRYVKGAAISGALFAGLMFYNYLNHKSFQLVDYKYPPGLYYLLYGLCISFLILAIGEATMLKYPFIKKASLFLSKNSYSLFFIHYILLDLIIKATKQSGFFAYSGIQFLIVFSLSLIICIGLDKLVSAQKKATPTREVASS